MFLTIIHNHILKTSSTWWEEFRMDFLQSLKLKHLMYLLIAPLLASVLVQLIRLQIAMLISDGIRTYHAARLACSVVVLLFLGLYWSNRSRRVYLVNFSSFKPDEKQKLTAERLIQIKAATGMFEPDSLEFQKKIMSRSGLSNETYVARGFLTSPPHLTIDESRFEAASAMFGSLDSLFEKTNVKPNEIDVLIINSGMFCTSPSLSSMIVNHYKLRDDIKSYNISGMGCSAGVISLDLAKCILKNNSDSYAVVVSTEIITTNWYFGNDKSMMLTNCIFRCGGAAVLLSNKSKDRSRSKYELVHTLRTHKGADERSYQCVVQKEDSNGIRGVSLSKELPTVAGEALKTNISALAPLVLPLSEKFFFFVNFLRRKMSKTKVKPYNPDFKRAFEHFCIHSGGRAVLDAVEKNLQLTEWHLEPSRMSLYRFANTSSSSLWYELAYLEAKGRIRRGDRIWQIAFGSGFKCNSAVWRALRPVKEGDALGNPWTDSINMYPVNVQIG